MPTLINSYSLSPIIGIGTNTPNENLTVIGNISATGTVYGNSGTFSTSVSSPILYGHKIIADGTWSGYGDENLGSIELIPNSNLYGQGQYLIIRPTSNFDEQHIHIEAGANGDLVLGSDDFYYKLNNHYLGDSEYAKRAEIGVCDTLLTIVALTSLESAPTSVLYLSLTACPWASNLSVGNLITSNGEEAYITTVGQYWNQKEIGIQFYPSLTNPISLGDEVTFRFTPRKVYSFDNLGNFILPLSGDIKDGNGVSLLSGIPLWNSTYSTVQANSAEWNSTTDVTKLPLSGGSLTNGLTGTTAVFTTSLSSPALSGSHYGDGTHLTGVIHNDDPRLTDSRAPSGVANGDLSGTYPSPTVAKIQGNIISTQTPANGQVLQWNGTAWGPGSIPTGGSGGGGVTYFFNQALSAQSPTTNLPLTAHQMGRVALSGQTILTSGTISQADYTLVGGYVTDVLDPQVDYIPAGIFDFNVWAYSNANVNNPTVLQTLVYTYDGVNAPVLISTSPDATLTNNGLYVQIPMSCLVPQTDVELTTRIYVEFRAKASASLKTVTIGFGNVTPTHVHTTIPSIGGSGLVKVIDGVWQSPASLLVDVDVAADAAINQTKVAGLTAALASKLPLTGGTLTGGITGTTADFTGAVYGSTAVAGTSSLQLATTAFVQDNLTTGLASGTAIASTVVALVTNADSVTLTRGTVVYSYGSQGDRVSVRMASASAEATSSKTLGLVNETIAVGQTGYVTLYGAMDKLDLGSPFVAGDPLWLGTTPGTFTRVKPVAPIHLVYLGVVQRANAGNGTAYIKVQNGYELNEIHDVLVATPLSAQILQRNDDNTLWINKTPLFNDTQIINSGKWNTAYSVATGYQSVSSTYVTLTGTQKLENKTVVDWMTLVRGYNAIPTLLATIPTGEVYTYVYNSSPSNVTYYRYIATDGSADEFYSSFSGVTLSGLVASKSIIL